MKLYKQVKDEFISEIDKLATKNIIKKLQKQGIDHNDLNEDEFDGLVEDEKEILKSDSKKVGVGIAIGAAITLLTGI